MLNPYQKRMEWRQLGDSRFNNFQGRAYPTQLQTMTLRWHKVLGSKVPRRFSALPAPFITKEDYEVILTLK
jgi:hypothetical protein